MILRAVDAHPPHEASLAPDRLLRFFALLLEFNPSFRPALHNPPGKICRACAGRASLRSPQIRPLLLTNMPTRILLAESDDVLRASLAEQLEREGYDVTAAQDGDGAQASLHEQLNFAIVGLSDAESVAANLRE